MPFSAAEATKRREKSASTGREPTRKRPRSASPSGVLTRALSARIRSHGLSTPRLTAASKQPPPETSRYAKPALSRISASRSCSAAGNPPGERLLPEQANGRVGERRHARSLPRETRASRGAFLLEPSSDRPCAFAGVREQRPRQEALLVVDGHESNPRVAAVEPDGTSAGRKPEAEPVTAIRARRASLSEHLRECLAHARSSPRRARARTSPRPRRSCRCHRRRFRRPVGGRRSYAMSPGPPRIRPPRARAARPSGGRPCHSVPAGVHTSRGRGRGRASPPRAPRSGRAGRSRCCSRRSARRAGTSADARRALRDTPRSSRGAEPGLEAGSP